MINLIRKNENWITIENQFGVDATILANEQVLIDRSTYQEVEDFLTLSRSLRELDKSVTLDKVVFSPDLHKGSGIPVGTSAQFINCAIPKAIGVDIGCGMQLTVLSTNPAIIGDKRLDSYLRGIFFEGKRNIALSRDERVAIFTKGPFETAYAPEEFLRSSAKSNTEKTKDDQLGSIGGGNHFVEIQQVEEILDPHKAYEWKISKGAIVVMAHTGSVSIGQYIGKKWQDKAKDLWPTRLKKPLGGFHCLVQPDMISQYYEELSAGVNFAFANRQYLTKMVIDSVEQFTNTKSQYNTIHDSSHNIAYATGLHRKGACSAKLNEPVIVPGSMGDYSYLLCGQGNTDSLCSCCHGAGRKTSRSNSRKYEEEINSIRLITKLDTSKQYFRKDILANYKKSLAEEAPSCYKDIGPAIDTCKNAGVAFPVAKLKPILTIKGY